ncbi:MAG: lipase maturation factor family protein, partial [Chlamydiota bacterium]
MDYWITRFCFQKALAFVYLVGFLIAFWQFKPLLGEKGLLPVPYFLQRVRFKDTPSLFFACSKDWFVKGASILGILLSLTALTGLSEAYGLYVSMAVWLGMWALYLSFVNVGQLFYGFGWEILLLETGFLAIFLGSSDREVPVIIIWLLRLVLFRVMLGSGLIKLRADRCWKDLTSMIYHYETQPLPGPLSTYFHRLPVIVHKSAALLTYFVELALPFGLFGPAIVRTAAGLITASFQGMLILSGNLSWLNYITLVLCVSCFDDHFLRGFIPLKVPVGLEAVPMLLIYPLVAYLLVLNIRPFRNLLSKNQMMNASFDPCRLVNTYGAFGSVTKVRREIIIEGTEATEITPDTVWKAYEFKAKPGDVKRCYPLVSPYNYKLDWQIWFAAMTNYQAEPWLISFVEKLLQGDKASLGLLKMNPFPEKPPYFIRGLLYEYHFSSPEE